MLLSSDTAVVYIRVYMHTNRQLQKNFVILGHSYYIHTCINAYQSTTSKKFCYLRAQLLYTYVYICIPIDNLKKIFQLELHGPKPLKIYL